MFCKHCGKNIYELEKCPFCNDGENVQEEEIEHKKETSDTLFEVEENKTDQDVKIKTQKNEKKQFDESNETEQRLRFDSAKDALAHWSNTSSIGKAKHTLESIFVGLFLFSFIGFVIIYFIASRSSSFDVELYIKNIGMLNGFLISFLVLWVFHAFRSCTRLLEALSRKSQAEWMKKENIDCRKILKYGKKLDKSSDFDLRNSLLVSEKPDSIRLFFAEFIISVVVSIISSIALSWLIVSFISGLYNGVESFGMAPYQAIISVLIRVDVLFLIFVEFTFVIVNTVLSNKIKNKSEDNFLSGD